MAKRFQTDINRNTDIVAARRKERDYFQNYRYMAERMGSEYLAKLLSKNIRKVVSEVDGYQPHLIAPEQGYRRLVAGTLELFRGTAEATVDVVHFILRELVRKSASETQVKFFFLTIFCLEREVGSKRVCIYILFTLDLGMFSAVMESLSRFR